MILKDDMTAKYCKVYDIEFIGYNLGDVIFSSLPDGQFKNILIKPNWVIHETKPYHPIDALVTSGQLIDLVIQECLLKYRTASEITIADAPIQSSNWPLMINQSGLDRVIQKYKNYACPKISFLDLRQEVVWFDNNKLIRSRHGYFGDPQGYREVIIGNESFLDPITTSNSEFRVADYNPAETQSNHSPGFHRYLIAGSILNADLIINMPKMKSHQKAGITGALKNLVGINGNKANLVHYRIGKNSTSGDEYPRDIPRLVVWQARIKDFLLGQSKFIQAILYKPMQFAWKLLRISFGIEVKSTDVKNSQKKFYLTGGAWFGNDTIWRMVYDINKIIMYSSKEGGVLQKVKQREYIAILDGIISGEGNGPLEPLPVKTDLVMFSNDPFLMDMTMARLMGFDCEKIPMLKKYFKFNDENWANFDSSTVEVFLNDSPYFGIQSLPTRHKFISPPGWHGSIELD